MWTHALGLRGSLESGFTQPRTHLVAHLCAALPSFLCVWRSYNNTSDANFFVNDDDDYAMSAVPLLRDRPFYTLKRALRAGQTDRQQQWTLKGNAHNTHASKTSLGQEDKWIVKYINAQRVELSLRLFIFWIYLSDVSTCKWNILIVNISKM